MFYVFYLPQRGSSLCVFGLSILKEVSSRFSCLPHTDTPPALYNSDPTELARVVLSSAWCPKKLYVRSFAIKEVAQRIGADPDTATRWTTCSPKLRTRSGELRTRNTRQSSYNFAQEIIAVNVHCKKLVQSFPSHQLRVFPKGIRIFLNTCHLRHPRRPVSYMYCARLLADAASARSSRPHGSWECNWGRFTKGCTSAKTLR